MDKYGLIGERLGHSFSKNFFNEKFENEHVDAQYLNFEIPDIGELKAVLDTNPELKGLNVTIPYKQQIIPYLNDITKEAKEIDAVNVVKVTRKKGKIYLKGYNSDVIGFRDSIKPLLEPCHTKALILGTGGASKAVAYGLKTLGLEYQLVSRNRKDGCITYDDITPETVDEYKVIVNCTPLGMYPNFETCPALPYSALNSRNLLYDLVYNPDETLFLSKGRQQGAITKNGLEMLLLQAYASWEFWNE